MFGFDLSKQFQMLNYVRKKEQKQQREIDLREGLKFDKYDSQCNVFGFVEFLFGSLLISKDVICFFGLK